MVVPNAPPWGPRGLPNLEPNAGAVPAKTPFLEPVPKPLPDTDPKPPLPEPLAGAPKEKEDAGAALLSSLFAPAGAPKEKEDGVVPPPSVFEAGAPNENEDPPLEELPPPKLKLILLFALGNIAYVIVGVFVNLVADNGMVRCSRGAQTHTPPLIHHYLLFIIIIK